VIGREGHISRIAHDVDHTTIPRVETFVALNETWTRRPLERTFRFCINVGNLALHIGKCNALVGVQKIAEKKSGPGIARFRIGNQTNVVGQNLNRPAGYIPFEKVIYDIKDFSYHFGDEWKSNPALSKSFLVFIGIKLASSNYRFPQKR
jgi:hypothetical protein